MSSIVLRTATPEDLPFLWQMLGAAVSPDGDPIPVAELQAVPELARYLEDWGRPGGVGHELIEGLLARAHAAGTPKLSLSVLIANTRGIRVYEDCGFEVAHLQDDGLAQTMVGPTRPPV